MNIEIESLTVNERLALVEQIWSSIQENPDRIPSPDWHGELLEERLQRLEAGEASVSSLAEVKKRMDDLRD